MPNINPDYINYLLKLKFDKDAYVTVQNNFIEPFNALYSKAIIPKIKDLVEQNQYGFQRLVRSLNTYFIQEQDVTTFNADNMFMNINNDKFADTVIICSNLTNAFVSPDLPFVSGKTSLGGP